MKISESEAQVMEVLWEQHPKTSGEVVEAVSRREDWSPKTIRTLLTRLLEKGAVSRSGSGRQYRYSPEISREEWLRDRAGNLIETHCRGRLAPLVSAFASSESLSEEDRAEILAILREMES